MVSSYYKRPRFSAGKLLRTEHMAALEWQSFEFPSLFFQGWGNGILAGCNLSTTADTVTMGPGVICFEGELFGIQEPVSIEYYPTDKIRYLKLYIGSNEGNDTCDVRRFSLSLSDHERLGSGELELCRFRLQPGAYLRCAYTDFRDRETLYDTLNTIYESWSAPGGTSLSPDITRAYAKEALAIGKIPDLDASICLQWLNGQFAVSRQMIQHYLARFSCVELEQGIDNKTLFQGLLARLEQLKEEKGQIAPQKKSGRRTILVE